VTDASDDSPSTNRLVGLVDAAVRGLVDHPDDVRVGLTERRGLQVLELRTAPEDMGKVIGRQGRTAAALRTIVTLAAEAHGLRAQLDILD
jgi:predicted RNA-binding protein YlqC (UPF0109 family)